MIAPKLVVAGLRRHLTNFVSASNKKSNNLGFGYRKKETQRDQKARYKQKEKMKVEVATLW